MTLCESLPLLTSPREAPPSAVGGFDARLCRVSIFALRPSIDSLLLHMRVVLSAQPERAAASQAQLIKYTKSLSLSQAAPRV